MEIIKKYYPNASEEELKKIQEVVYLLACAVMQYFYGNDWEKDSDNLDLENKEDRFNNLIISSNLNGVILYKINFDEFSTIHRG